MAQRNNYLKEEKKLVIDELKKMSEAREDFYRYLDENISQDENNIYEFKDNKLDAKEIYSLFFKMDYQSRKLKGLLVDVYGLKAE